MRLFTRTAGPLCRAAGFFLLLFSTAPLHAQAARTDVALTASLREAVRGFHGEVGIYVKNLRTGATAQINADTVFPTASMIKVPILLALYDQVERGKLDLEKRMPRPDTLNYRYVESTDVVGYMAPGDTLPLRELAFLMLTVSDNVASLWIQAEVGGGAAVNEWLAGHGFRQTRVNSRTPGRQGRAVSARASEDMYRMLTNSYWKGEALSQIPPTVQAASKQGFVDRSRSEVLLVNAPGGDYVLAVITKNQADTSYDEGNEGSRLLRAVSRTVYRHFNPGDPWRPQR
jgi:beta-lactamase class A